jgi:hypothetical protein
VSYDPEFGCPPEPTDPNCDVFADGTDGWFPDECEDFPCVSYDPEFGCPPEPTDPNCDVFADGTDGWFPDECEDFPCVSYDPEFGCPPEPTDPNCDVFGDVVPDDCVTETITDETDNDAPIDLPLDDCEPFSCDDPTGPNTDVDITH